MRRLPLIMLVTLGILAACGSNRGITVNFVGNSTCRTANQSPYSPSPPNTNSAPVGKPIDEMPHLHVAQGTVITYNCPTGCDSQIQALSTWYQTLPPDPGGGVAYAKFIAVPYAAQKETWDVESWDWFDPMGSTLSLNEVKKFYANHVNQAPEG